MRTVILALKFVLLILLTVFFVSPAMAQSKGGTLKVEVLKLYMSSSLSSHARMDVRFINSTPDNIKHWAIDVEVYDKEGNYLAKAEDMVSHIRSGESKVETLIIPNTQSSAIASYRVTLGAIVGYSGLREDRKYKLELISAGKKKR